MEHALRNASRQDVERIAHAAVDAAKEWLEKPAYEKGESLGRATTAIASEVAIDVLTDGLGSVATLRKVGKVAEAADHVRDAEKVMDRAARTERLVADSVPYKRPSGATTPAQRAAVQGKPCVDCGVVTPRQVADHKLPLVKEHYETGDIDKVRMRSVEAVQPQCPTCSGRQGAELSRYSREQNQQRKRE